MKSVGGTAKKAWGAQVMKAANTHVSYTPQQEQRQLSTETSTPLESSEAAGFSSDNSPRNETGV